MLVRYQTCVVLRKGAQETAAASCCCCRDSFLWNMCLSPDLSHALFSQALLRDQDGRAAFIIVTATHTSYEYENKNGFYCKLEITCVMLRR